MKKPRKRKRTRSSSSTPAGMARETQDGPADTRHGSPDTESGGAANQGSVRTNLPLNMPPAGPTPAEPPQTSRQPSAWLHFLEHLKLYLGIATSIVAILGAAWAYSPSLSIAPSTVVDNSNPTNAEFTVTNTGRVPVYNVVFSCAIRPDKGPQVTSRGNISRQNGYVAGQGIQMLAPSQPITRNCAAGQMLSVPVITLRYPASLDVTVEYSWPLIGKRASITKTFRSRSTQSGGVTIVPDSD